MSNLLKVRDALALCHEILNKPLKTHVDAFMIQMTVIVIEIWRLARTLNVTCMSAEFLGCVAHLS